MFDRSQAMLAAGPPAEVPEAERANWVHQVATNIQAEIMRADLAEMLSGAAILDAPVQGGTWLCTATTSEGLAGVETIAEMPPVVFIQPCDYGTDVITPA